jgi:hypothetical protein
MERVANLEGRSGVSMGRVESADNSRQDLIIDTRTGALIGERRVDLSEAVVIPPLPQTSFAAVRMSLAMSLQVAERRTANSAAKAAPTKARGPYIAERANPIRMKSLRLSGAYTLTLPLPAGKRPAVPGPTSR